MNIQGISSRPLQSPPPPTPTTPAADSGAAHPMSVERPPTSATQLFFALPSVAPRVVEDPHTALALDRSTLVSGFGSNPKQVEVDSPRQTQGAVISRIRDPRTTVTTTRYPDNSSVVEIEHRADEAGGKLWIFGRGDRTIGTETVRIDADGRVSGTRVDLKREERFFVDFGRLKLGFSVSGGGGARGELGTGLEASTGFNGRLGLFSETGWRSEELYFQAGTGLGGCLRSSSYGEQNDGSSCLAVPGIPVSGDASRVGGKQSMGIDLGLGKLLSFGVGTERQVAYAALPLAAGDSGLGVALDVAAPVDSLANVERQVRAWDHSDGVSPLDRIERRLDALDRQPAPAGGIERFGFEQPANPNDGIERFGFDD